MHTTDRAFEAIMTTPWASGYFGGEAAFRNLWSATDEQGRRTFAARLGTPGPSDKQVAFVQRLYATLGREQKHGGAGAIAAFYGLWTGAALRTRIAKLRAETNLDHAPASREQILLLTTMERRAGISMTPYEELRKLTFADLDGRIRMLKLRNLEARETPSATVTSLSDFRARRGA